MSSERSIKSRLSALLDGRGFFKTHELVTIGLFAAGSRAATLTLALLGGGMNPLTMIIRSAVHSALLLVLLAKVPKTGVMTMAALVGGLLAFFLMGQGMVTLPAVVIATILVELLVKALGGLERRRSLGLLAVILSELFTRIFNVGFSYLAFREQPAMVIMVVVISAFSYLGILLGLIGGVKMVRELRHAGLIG
ncbi:MAG: MptD family putative ECF transporter S component [Deltaproteobacteria bacterium]|nr:MptD family putative ECF transporter S component [Deltaproteobacteria bacterium]